jgi:hypothetical protein
MSTLIGTVEKVEYTSGSLGNQWTTIDGVKYATWWDIRGREWNIGDRVEHEPYRTPGFANVGPRSLLATGGIRKVQP